MIRFSSSIPLEQVLVCDPDPDSRASLTKKLLDLGYQVLATGNAQVACGLLQEKQFGAFILSLPCMKLTMLSPLVLSRRSNPSMPVVIVFNQSGNNNVPRALVDLVLNQPDERTLIRSLKALIQGSHEIAKVS